MKYDFETVLDRSGKDIIAANRIPFDGVSVDPGFDVIPMWIADMAFPTAKPVLDAINERLAFPNMGYFELGDAYFNSIISWQQRRNGIDGLAKEHIGYENGVLGGVSSAAMALTMPNEKILVHSPTYVGFTGTMKKNGRELVHSPLVRDENGIWRMDFEDMDRKLKENNIHLAIFCSPHNPCGRVWEKWEIEKAMEIYEANDCYVISDEIWSDIISPGFRHIPTQSVNAYAHEHTAAFYAPSKSFSLAGLVGSYHIIYNKYLRDRIDAVSRMSCYNDCNVLSMYALQGAFGEEGEQWLEEMNSVISDNLDYATDFIRANFPGVQVMRAQGTYMLFLDCSGWCSEHGVSITELQHRGVRCGVIWQNGEAFLLKDSIRMNLALPKSRLIEALDRLKKYAFV